MDKFIKNYDNKDKKGGGCLSWLLGTLAVILGVAVYAVLSSLLNRWLIGARFGSEPACALLPLTMTGLTVAFVLYEAIFIVRLIRFGNEKDDAKAKRIARIVTVACICLSFVFAIFSANTFTELRGDHISKVCFTEIKRYEWTSRCDVQRYALSCDDNGVLAFTVTMKDGEKIELWSQVNSCTLAFNEDFDGVYGYGAYLAEQFHKSEFIIESSVTGIDNMERIYKDSNPEIWAILERIINLEK